MTTTTATEYPGLEANKLAEAMKIVRGETMMLATKEHLKALAEVNSDLLEAACMAHEFITRIANTMPVAANGESLTLLKLSAAISKAGARQ